MTRKSTIVRIERAGAASRPAVALAGSEAATRKCGEAIRLRPGMQGGLALLRELPT
jgi:hypothetical protein